MYECSRWPPSSSSSCSTVSVCPEAAASKSLLSSTEDTSSIESMVVLFRLLSLLFHPAEIKKENRFMHADARLRNFSINTGRRGVGRSSLYIVKSPFPSFATLPLSTTDSNFTSSAPRTVCSREGISLRNFRVTHTSFKREREFNGSLYFSTVLSFSVGLGRERGREAGGNCCCCCCCPLPGRGSPSTEIPKIAGGRNRRERERERER